MRQRLFVNFTSVFPLLYDKNNEKLKDFIEKHYQTYAENCIEDDNVEFEMCIESIQM